MTLMGFYLAIHVMFKMQVVHVYKRLCSCGHNYVIDVTLGH